MMMIAPHSFYFWRDMAIHVGPGFAAESHRHYAPQLLLGLDSPIALRAREPEPWRSYTAAWIPSRAWHHYTGKTSWTAAHERYLAEVRFDHPAQDIAYGEYRSAVREAHERTERITAALREQVATWRWHGVVRALMALRGVEFVAAVTLVAELGDLARFAHPKQLLSYLGLVPSEYSTGESRVQGRIIKTGNGHARRILIESAWTYRLPARTSRDLVVRSEGQSKAVRDIACRAQLRLCSRSRRLQAQGVHHNKTCTAIAREFAAFVWDIARQVPAAP